MSEKQKKLSLLNTLDINTQGNDIIYGRYYFSRIKNIRLNCVNIPIPLNAFVVITLDNDMTIDIKGSVSFIIEYDDIEDLFIFLRGD